MADNKTNNNDGENKEGMGNNDEGQNNEPKAKEANNNSDNDSSNQSNEPKAKSFSEDEVNKKLSAKEAEVYKTLGLNLNDKESIEEFKKFMESKKSDSEKEVEKKASEMQEAKENETRILIAETKAEVMVAGVQAQFVDDAVTLILANKKPDDDIKTIVSSFKKKYPAWFDKESSDEGTGRTPGASKKDGEKKVEGIGKRLAARKAPKKSSYFK